MVDSLGRKLKLTVWCILGDHPTKITGISLLSKLHFIFFQNISDQRIKTENQRKGKSGPMIGRRIERLKMKKRKMKKKDLRRRIERKENLQMKKGETDQGDYFFF